MHRTTDHDAHETYLKFIKKKGPLQTKDTCSAVLHRQVAHSLRTDYRFLSSPKLRPLVS
jgi:hypothetical protein